MPTEEEITTWIATLKAITSYLERRTGQPRSKIAYRPRLSDNEYADAMEKLLPWLKRQNDEGKRWSTRSIERRWGGKRNEMRLNAAKTREAITRAVANGALKKSREGWLSSGDSET